MVKEAATTSMLWPTVPTSNCELIGEVTTDAPTPTFSILLVAKPRRQKRSPCRCSDSRPQCDNRRRSWSLPFGTQLPEFRPLPVTVAPGIVAPRRVRHDSGSCRPLLVCPKLIAAVSMTDRLASKRAEISFIHAATFLPFSPCVPA